MFNYKCEKCDKEYTKYFGLCKSCQIKNFKKEFTSSGNEEIDKLIQEMQVRINSPSDIVFEWIPYNQLDDIKTVNKGDIATIYSAVWKDGSLYYEEIKGEYTRKSNIKVSLKCLYNSQNITDEFLNEVWNYFISLL